MLPTSDIDPGDATICKKTAARLLLPIGERLSVSATATREWRLGPLLAILISEDKLHAMQHGARDSAYRRYAGYAEEMGGQLVFVSLSGIHPVHGRMTGFQYGDGVFRPVRIPIPRVFYDRSFGPDGRDEAIAFRKIAQDIGVLVLNEPVKITKLDTHDVLMTNANLRSFLPHTEPLTDSALINTAKSYGAIYLKPDSLSKGQGVFRASLAAGTWLLERSDANGNEAWEVKDTSGLRSHLIPNVPYLVQQAIDLATYWNNHYDLRAAVQKDTQGRWQVTGLVARLAPPLGVVTSPRSGGSVLPADVAFAHSFGSQQVDTKLALVHETACAIATAIEHHYGHCANLGLDLGIDKSGRLWLIEVNGRPLAVSLTRLNDPAINARIFRYPIAYAAALDTTLPAHVSLRDQVTKDDRS